MKITDVRLYTVKSGDTGGRSAAMGESQYWVGGGEFAFPVIEKHFKRRSELNCELLTPFAS